MYINKNFKRKNAQARFKGTLGKGDSTSEGTHLLFPQLHLEHVGGVSGRRHAGEARLHAREPRVGVAPSGLVALRVA